MHSLNEHNYQRSLGEKGHETGTMANAFGYRKYQQEQDEKRRKEQADRDFWERHRQQEIKQEEERKRRKRERLERRQKTEARKQPPKTEKTEKKTYFSWFGAVTSFLLCFGGMMQDPDVEVAPSIFVSFVVAYIVGKIWKYLLWFAAAIGLLYLLFGQ